LGSLSTPIYYQNTRYISSFPNFERSKGDKKMERENGEIESREGRRERNMGKREREREVI
jgi:hypothetical protein